MSGNHRERERTRVRQADRPGIALQQAHAAGHLPACGVRSIPGTGEHCRVRVDAGDVVPCLRERDGEPSGTGGKLQDRAVGTRCERQQQVEIARIVLEVEVVQAGERCRRGLRHTDGRS